MPASALYKHFVAHILVGMVCCGGSGSVTSPRAELSFPVSDDFETDPFASGRWLKADSNDFAGGVTWSTAQARTGSHSVFVDGRSGGGYNAQTNFFEDVRLWTNVSGIPQSGRILFSFSTFVTQVNRSNATQFMHFGNDYTQSANGGAYPILTLAFINAGFGDHYHAIYGPSGWERGPFSSSGMNLLPEDFLNMWVDHTLVFNQDAGTYSYTLDGPGVFQNLSYAVDRLLRGTFDSVDEIASIPFIDSDYYIDSIHFGTPTPSPTPTPTPTPCPSPTGSSPILISEFMAINDFILADSDGDFVDWIEICNTGSEVVSLAGWYLTDSAFNLTKWGFPSVMVPPEGYLVVFASDKDRAVPGAPLHTNFKLSGDGEYLALVMPDGTTVAHEYIPAYPPQQTDVSYGLCGADPGYFGQPTPGGPNSGWMGPYVPPPMFSRAGGAFAEPFNLELSADSPDAMVHYTLNDSEPTRQSTPYTGPILIDTTTRVRARVYDAGDFAGPVDSRVYIRLDQEAAEFQTHLPLVVIDSLSYDFVKDDDPWTNYPNRPVYSSFIEPSDQSRSALTDPPQFSGHMGMRVRGFSSKWFPKKQYNIEIWDESNDDKEIALLGLPEESDWILFAPYSDKSLMRNHLAFLWSSRIGHGSIRNRFVEVFINMDGGAVSMDDYVGVYQLMEKIKRDNNRIDVERLEPSDESEPEITGGYIFKLDHLKTGESYDFYTKRDRPFMMVYPDRLQITGSQMAWIKGYVDEFEDALFAADFTHPETGKHYTIYVETDSFVNLKIIQEIAKNHEFSGQYLIKDRNQKMRIGPPWDYNLALANGDIPGFPGSWEPEGWFYPVVGHLWWERMFADFDFMQLWIDRWTELRRGPLSDEQLIADIEGTVELLGEAIGRNFERWPILGTYVWPNRNVFDTYEEEISYMQQFLLDRAQWFDGQFVDPPSFNRNGGFVPSGFELTMDGSAQDASTSMSALIAEGASARYLIPDDSSMDSSWFAQSFDDGDWASGSTGIGYERSSGYESLIITDVESGMYDHNTSIYIRLPFESHETVAIESLTLKMKYDDGFVAYLNGRRVASSLAPESPQWNSAATTDHPDQQVTEYESFSLTDFIGELYDGMNVLSIHGLNNTQNSSDLLILPRLEATYAPGAGPPPTPPPGATIYYTLDGSDPRLTGGAASESAQTYSAPLILTETTQVYARAWQSGHWSGPNRATFIVTETDAAHWTLF